MADRSHGASEEQSGSKTGEHHGSAVRPHGHVHGGMSIEEQERTYHAFVRWLIRSVIAIFVVLILLAFLNA